MKAMPPASSRALTIAAAVVLLIGFMVMSPSAGFAAFGLATLLAASPAIFGAGKIRLVAIILLLCAAALAVAKYQDFKDEQSRYRRHTQSP